MDNSDFTYLKSRINQEGFHYCFTQYSSFKDIDDPIFHKLRLDYIKSAEKLSLYIDKKTEDEFYND